MSEKTRDSYEQSHIQSAIRLASDVTAHVCHGMCHFSTCMVFAMREKYERCSGCGKQVDPTVCWCGIAEEDHNWYNDPHNFIPMGCRCGFVKDEKTEDRDSEGAVQLPEEA